MSDELSKVNSQVENVVRKVERQYLDLKAASKSSNANADSGLKVNENSVETYLRKFQWDFARFQFEVSLKTVIHIFIHKFVYLHREKC